MPRRRALAHPLPARQAYLAIQLHGMNPPALALAVAGKGHTGRVLLRRGRTAPPLPWSTFAPPFPLDRAQVQLRDRLQNEPRQMVLREPVTQRRGEQIRLVLRPRLIRFAHQSSRS